MKVGVERVEREEQKNSYTNFTKGAQFLNIMHGKHRFFASQYHQDNSA